MNWLSFNAKIHQTNLIPKSITSLKSESWSYTKENEELDSIYQKYNTEDLKVIHGRSGVRTRWTVRAQRFGYRNYRREYLSIKSQQNNTYIKTLVNITVAQSQFREHDPFHGRSIQGLN